MTPELFAQIKERDATGGGGAMEVDFHRRALLKYVAELEAALETKIGPDKKDVSPAVCRVMSKFWAKLAERIEAEREAKL